MAASDAMTRRYDLMRQRATGAAEAQNQQEQDALKRRAAAMGTINSGSFLKQQQTVSDQGAQRAQAAREGVDVQELADQARLEEAQQQRAWQSGEAEKQRGWGTSERTAGQAFTSGEAEKQRGWQSGEAATQRGWQTGERLSSQDFTSAEAGKQRDWQSGEAAAQRQAQREEFWTQLHFEESKWNQGLELEMRKQGWEEEVGRFNMEIASKEANKQFLPGLNVGKWGDWIGKEVGSWGQGWDTDSWGGGALAF